MLEHFLKINQRFSVAACVSHLHCVISNLRTLCGWRSCLKCINIMRNKLMLVIFWHIDSHKASCSKMNCSPVPGCENGAVVGFCLFCLLFVWAQIVFTFSPSWLWVGSAAGETEGNGVGDGEHCFQRAPQSRQVGVLLTEEPFHRQPLSSHVPDRNDELDGAHLFICSFKGAFF